MAKILVAEDEAIVRLFVVEMLEKLGHTVLEAADGQGALDLIHGHSDLDLVVSDIGLPKIDGFSLALSARRLRPHLALIFLTGYPRVEPPGELSPAIIIRKPFDPECFANKITATLNTGLVAFD